jgi:hypothetical protein
MLLVSNDRKSKNQGEQQQNSDCASAGKHSLDENRLTPPPQGGVLQKLCTSARSCKTGKRSEVIPTYAKKTLYTHLIIISSRQTKSSLNRVTFQLLGMCCEVSSRMDISNECHPIHYDEFQDPLVKFLIRHCNRFTAGPS